MTILIGKSHDLGLYARTVTRTDTSDLTVIERRISKVIIQYFMNFRIGVDNPARTVTQRAPDTGKERELVEVTHITLLFCKLETYCTSVNARGCPCLHPVGTKTDRDKLFCKTFGSILRDAATFYLDSAEMHETVQEGTRCQNNLPRLEDNPERGLYSGNLQ